MAKVIEKLSAKEIAAEFDTTPRTIRKFFRAELAPVGQGNRYAFTPAEVKKMRGKFDKWSAAQAETPAPEAN